MVWKNKWIMMMINAIIGGSYIAAILLMIHWVSTGQMGVAAFMVPVAILILVVLRWTVFDRLGKFKFTKVIK